MLEKTVERVLDKKHIRGSIRPIDHNFLRMVLLGYSVHEIADKLGDSPGNIRMRLKDPYIRGEIKRLDRRIDKEMITLIRAVKKRKLAIENILEDKKI